MEDLEGKTEYTDQMQEQIKLPPAGVPVGVLINRVPGILRQ